MDEQQNNALNFEDGESADIYDFSWEGNTEEVVNAEIADMSSAIYKVAKLIKYLIVNNNYKETARECSQLLNNYVGRNCWIQEFYYANQKDFEPYMRSNEKPKGYYDWSEKKRSAFDLGLKCQRDAAWACKPFDDISLLLRKVPLESAFKMMQGTIILGDAGFDEEQYSEIDKIVGELNEFFGRDWPRLEDIADRNASKYYKENYGKISPNSLEAGYRKERLNDYRTAFRGYSQMAGRYFKVNDQCVCGADLNFLMCLSTVDDYMWTVAKALKENIDTIFEQCLEDSKKLAAVLVSRNEKCSTDIFKAAVQSIEALNHEIYDFCELGLNMCKNYRGRISAAPYCFMKYPPACNNINRTFGFVGINTDPLESGSKYALLMGQAQEAISLQCRWYVYDHGETDFGS